MQLTYNKFRQIVDKSNERIFDKIAEALAASDNAALVSMYDDRLIVLDEENEDFYLCDYIFENGVLTMKNFDSIRLSENDSNYLDKVVDKYFDLNDAAPITIGEMMAAVNLKFKNHSRQIYSETRDRKFRHIQESARLRAIKKARSARNLFVEDIKRLVEEDFYKKLQFKVDGDSKDSVPSALSRVKFDYPYPISVNTEQGRPVNMIKIKDETNVMDAMADVASHLSDKWKSDAFRSKFEKMISTILQTESSEMAKTAVLNFLDENKELFLLRKDLFEELITKTTLMCDEGDSESVVKIFEGVLATKPARQMKHKFFKDSNLTEEKIARINALAEADDNNGTIPTDASDASGSTDGGGAGATANSAGNQNNGGDKAADGAGNDLQIEELNKIIDIFKKIQGTLDKDSPEKSYVDGLISALDQAKVSGIEDSKMKEIIDYLNAPLEAPADGGDKSKDDASAATDDDSGKEDEVQV